MRGGDIAIKAKVTLPQGRGLIRYIRVVDGRVHVMYPDGTDASLGSVVDEEDVAFAKIWLCRCESSREAINILQGVGQRGRTTYVSL